MSGPATGLAPARDGLSCRPVYVALLTFSLVAVVTVGLIWRYEADRLQAERASLSGLAAERAWALQTSIEHALSLTDTLAVMLRQGKGSIPDFEATAARLLRLYPGAVALQLAPRGALVLTLPPAVNTEGMGHDLLRDPESANESPAAGDGRRLALIGPLTLREGRQVAAGRLSIFLDDGHGQEAFWGFAVVVLAIPEVLAQARLAELQERGYAWELSRVDPTTRQEQVIRASSSPLIAPVEHSLSVANVTWTLRIAPALGWRDVSGVLWKCAAALLLSLLLAWHVAWQARLFAATRAHGRNLELRVAQRTADLQRFAEVTAHHLQEPVRRVASYAGRLRAQLAGRVDDAEVQASLDFICQQAVRLQELLRDVELYLAADQPRGSIEACDAEQTLSRVLVEFADVIAQAAARVEVGRLPAAMIDSPRLRELFRVVLDNALRHGRGAQSLRIEIAGERVGASVRYRISDNGPGVEDEYRQRVFRVFERLVTSGGGTGVGLAILRRIAESAGGYAWLEEAAGGGCSVLIELPAGDVAPTAPHATLEARP